MESKNPPLPSSQSSILQPGTSTPEFSLNTTPDQIVSLKDFRGKLDDAPTAYEKFDKRVDGYIKVLLHPQG